MLLSKWPSYIGHNCFKNVGPTFYPPTKSEGYSFGVVRASMLLIWIWGPF